MEVSEASRKDPLSDIVTVLWWHQKDAPRKILHYFLDNEGANSYFVAWFTLNVAITLFSKRIYDGFDFPYPMMLTAVHMLFTWMGSELCRYMSIYNTQPIDKSRMGELLFFSAVFTANIWLSNYSLMLVSVALHQVCRTAIPLFTMVISLVYYKEWYPLRMLPSVLTVIAGVSITVWGDMDTTVWGSLITFLGCALSSLKGLMSQKAQIGPNSLHTFDLLRTVCPMAVAELLFLGIFNGETRALAAEVSWDRATIVVLVSQGLMAAALNYVSFRVSALKNPLTMNIAGNVKQVLTPLISFAIFGGVLPGTLAVGLFATLAGAIWYTTESRRRTRVLQGKSEREGVAV